jgi:hypothetical protein
MPSNEISRLKALARGSAALQIDIPAETAAMIKNGSTLGVDPYVMVGLLVEGVVHIITTAVPAERRAEVASAALQLLADRMTMAGLN